MKLFMIKSQKIKSKITSHFVWFIILSLFFLSISFPHKKHFFYRYVPDNCIQPSSEIYLRKIISDSMWVDYVLLNNKFFESDTFIIRNGIIVGTLVGGSLHKYFDKISVGDTISIYEHIRVTTFNNYEENKYLFLGFDAINGEEILNFKSEYGDTFKVVQSFGIIRYDIAGCLNTVKIIPDKEVAEHIANSLGR